jgi:hypothetical protein
MRLKVIVKAVAKEQYLFIPLASLSSAPVEQWVAYPDDI